MIMCQPSRINSARCVARFQSNGYEGTGTLINDESYDGKAYFLTAFHVVDVNNNKVIDASEIAALQNAKFQFQFWRTTCNGTINNTFIQFSGATVRASSKYSDIILLELLNPPGIGDGVNYAGWNRTTSTPDNSLSSIIHHPQGQDMRITNTNNVRTWLYNSSYWTAHYSSGTTEPGSSGAALLNENTQIVGQLRSGWSSCNFTDFGDRYGKFSSSWGGANLQQWLSPAQGLSSINSLIITPLTIQGNNFVGCTSNNTYSVPNLLGCTYIWAVSNNLNIVSGQGTSTIIVSRINSPVTAGSIQVTINDSKGLTRIVTVSLNVTVGLITPVITAQQSSGSGEPTTYLFTGPPLSNTTYSWYVNNVLQTGETANTFDLYFPCNITKTVKCKISNSCGTSGFSNSISRTGGCIRNSFTLSPNPASNTLNISISETNSVDAADTHIDEVKIYDLQGSMKMDKKYNRTTSAEIDISNLTNGTYFIEITDDTYKEKQQLFIQK